MNKSILYYGPVLIIGILTQSCFLPRPEIAKNAYILSDTITLDPMNGPIHTSMDLFKPVQYLPLSSGTDHLIGAVSQGYIYENNIWIVDKKNSKAIFCFDTLGNFKYKINRFGKGPGEYSYIQDVAVDVYNQTLVLYDRMQRKIISYDWDGKFIDEIYIEPYFQSIAIIDKNTIGAYQIQYKSTINGQQITDYVVYLSRKGDMISSFLPFKHSINQPPNNLDRNFYINPGRSTLLLSAYFPNKVLEMTTQGVQEKYYLDFGKYHAPFDENKLYEIGALEEIKQSGYALGVQRFAENSDYAIFSYIFSRRNVESSTHYCLYSKKSKSYKILKNMYSPSEIDGIPRMSFPYCSIGNDFIFIVGAADVLNAFKSVDSINNSFSRSYNQDLLKKSTLKLTESSNPVLVRYRVKPF